MPLFRSGKPHWRLGLSANAVIPALGGLITWTVEVEGDPALVLPLPTTTVQVDRAGLYLVSCRVARPSVVLATGNHIILELDGVQVAYTLSPPTTSSIYGILTAILQVPDDGQLRIRHIGATAAASVALAGLTEFSVTRIGPVRWTG